VSVDENLAVVEPWTVIRRRTHASVHVEAAAIPADLLECEHSDGRWSFRVADDAVQVWVIGTVADLHGFAEAILRAAERLEVTP
jgi:hypothetical protein